MPRTDEDSWDLATSVGATATLVAGQRVLAHREGLIDDPYAEPLVRAVGLDFTTKVLDGEVSYADVDPLFTTRFAAEGMAVRTRFFDQLFLDAFAAGIRQAVILAAGLDARAYRLPWPDGTVVYEVDQPEVVEFKRRTLADVGASPTAIHRTVPIDLRQDWPKALRDKGFDPTQPTAWIAEGLLIYLPSDAQDKLFDDVTRLSTPGSLVACERVHDVSAFISGRSADAAQKLRDLGSTISFEDLVYQGERTNVVDHLAQLGWTATELSSREAYAANGFDPLDDVFSQRFGELSYVRAELGPQNR